jgi:hypothetical protein
MHFIHKFFDTFAKYKIKKKEVSTLNFEIACNKYECVLSMRKVKIKG